LTLEGKIKIALLKKGVPGPIIISLNKKPTKILPKAKIIKGKDILRGESPLKEEDKEVKEELGSVKKVKYNNLNE
jgi:hypothetical protein